MVQLRRLIMEVRFIMVDINSLKKLSTIEEEYKEDIKGRNVIKALGQAQSFPSSLQEEWKRVAKIKEESITFYNSNVIVQGATGYVYSSISELLIAGYGYQLFLTLMNYYDIINDLRQKSPLYKELADNIAFESAVKKAKSNSDGPLVELIKTTSFSINVNDNTESIAKLLEFVTEYDKWGGGKTINRGQDFWISPLYKVLGFVQSRSGIHSYISYFEDSTLYKATKEEISRVLNEFNSNITSSLASPAYKLNLGTNMIYYGAPGTGKSYAVNELIKENKPNYESEDESSNVFRVTLHPEYSYADFVGQLLPYSDELNNVGYKFAPGIFTTALKRAVNEPNKQIYLVLEELSRANVAAVFGDLFQLLDRKNGTSEYPINNPDIALEVYKNKNQMVTIPNNMMILCTVNTSDQNVYPMDTAFKRRFEWKYVSTDFGSTSPDFLRHNNPIIDIGDEVKITWSKFYQGLNDFIVGDLGLSEDKQIGPYFIKFEDAPEDEAHRLVKDKLLQYLWEDIHSMALTMHYSSTNLFLDRNEIHSFSSLYARFNDHKQIFSTQFLSKLGVNNGTGSTGD